MSEVFVSYATVDKDRVRPLVKVLVDQGWTVWWDPTIPPGQMFDEVIEKALESARCVVVIWSKESVSSRWVKTEAHEGLLKGILVPVLFDDVRIPLEFRRIQAAQLSNWEGDPTNSDIVKLMDSIRSILSDSPESSRRPMIIPQSEKSLPLNPPSPPPRKELSLGVLVIIAGGNISLCAASNRRGDWALKPASIAEIKAILLGSGASDSLTIRESGLKGVHLRVDFRELRHASNLQYSDPEDLDSAQLNPSLWEYLANMIGGVAGKYEGIVILHGLDTIAYTASALSFMLGNIGIPVILTGAQLPLNYARTDAIQNVIASITLAASTSVGFRPGIPEVAVFSCDALFRGNRATLTNSSSYRFLGSPTYPPLAVAGERLDVRRDLVRKQDLQNLVHIRGKAHARVVVVDVFPGIGSSMIESLKQDQLIRGVLLRTYGSGTAPMSPGFLEALHDLVASGVVVMNVTEAQTGSASRNDDPVSLRLFEQGVISAQMTTEAAYAKMVVELSNSTEDADVIGDLLQIDNCGELTQSVYHIHYDAGETKPDEAVNRAILSPKRPIVGLQDIKLENISYIQVFILGISPAGRVGAINYSTDIDLAIVDKAQESDKTGRELQQATLRWSHSGRSTINVVYDITHAKSAILDPEMLLRLESIASIRWTRLSVAIHTEGNNS